MNALTLICQTIITIAELVFIAILLIVVVLIIFLAIFVIDFKKEISNNPSINDKSMSTRNVSNNLSGFDGKSFAQALKPTLASAGKSFSQTGAGAISPPKPQTTASQPQQQSNLQTNNK